MSLLICMRLIIGTAAKVHKTCAGGIGTMTELRRKNHY
jgi:hypothetical protein